MKLVSLKHLMPAATQVRLPLLSAIRMIILMVTVMVGQVNTMLLAKMFFKGNYPFTLSEHVCTISCGHVNCAMEENEKSALHAFAIMKPCGYAIQEITPAVFSSDPTCRWIVAYTHITEPVSSFNADKTFKNITRSTPNNVRVIQKYIRGKSSQMLAAYVVVYGVNCRCQGDILNTFDFPMNGIKCEV